MKKFRVVSDLHIDFNYDYPVRLKKDGVFTVVAGDTSGQTAFYVAKSADRRSLKVSSKHADLTDVMRDRSTVRLVCKENPVQPLCDYDHVTNWTYDWYCDGKPFDLAAHGIHLDSKPIGGDVIKVTKMTLSQWLKKNISSGIVIAGNHIVYNRMGMTIEDLKRRYAKELPPDSDITFLDYDTGVMSKEVDGILFVGTTLYTNYELPTSDYADGGMNGRKSAEERVAFNMKVATPKMSGGGMNDFNLGLTEDGGYAKQPWDTTSFYYLRPQNYLKFFKRSFEALKRIVEENPNKDIVVVTHHCPSTKCISKEYVDDIMNASYVSDLDDFIVSHPQIKCWVCGHVHHRDSFKIGNCLCVMNPLGYCKYGQYKGGSDGLGWSPDVFVNTEDWTVEKIPYSNNKWDATLSRYQKDMAKWIPFMM